MFRVLYPNRWLVWTIVLLLITAIVLLWAIEKFSIEQELDIANDYIFFQIKVQKKNFLKGDQMKEAASISGYKAIKVLSPNGSEVWQRGKQYNIRWTNDLKGSVKVSGILIKPPSLIRDPYRNPPPAGREMFVPSTFPANQNEGSYTYTFPHDLAPGNYQVIIWAGENCPASVAQRQERCNYDLSDGFFTVR